MLIGQNVKNKFINANFSLWQRGTNFNLATNFAQTADRHRIPADANGGTLAAGTVSQVAFAPGEFEDQKYFLRIANTTQGSSLGVGSYHGFEQLIEDVATFGGKKVTVSIWARSTIPNKVLTVYCFQYFGSGGSAAVFVPSTNIILTASVQRYDITFNIPSVSGKIVGAGSAVSFGTFFQTGASIASKYGVSPVSWQGTGNTDIIRWQVNEGGKADFETAGRNASEELALGQRYYQKSGEIHFIPQRADLSAQAYRLERAMRLAPIVTLYSAGSGLPGKVYQVDGVGAPIDRAASASSVTADGQYYVYSTGSQLTAGTHNLYYYTAEAEL